MSEEISPADQDLPRMREAARLATQMDTGVGDGEVLLRAVPPGQALTANRKFDYCVGICPVSARRISRSVPLTLAAFSLPMRINMRRLLSRAGGCGDDIIASSVSHTSGGARGRLTSSAKHVMLARCHRTFLRFSDQPLAGADVKRLLALTATVALAGCAVTGPAPQSLVTDPGRLPHAPLAVQVLGLDPCNDASDRTIHLSPHEPVAVLAQPSQLA